MLSLLSRKIAFWRRIQAIETGIAGVWQSHDGTRSIFKFRCYCPRHEPSGYESKVSCLIYSSCVNVLFSLGIRAPRETLPITSRTAHPRYTLPRRATRLRGLCTLPGPFGMIECDEAQSYFLLYELEDGRVRFSPGCCPPAEAIAMARIPYLREALVSLALFYLIYVVSALDASDLFDAEAGLEFSEAGPFSQNTSSSFDMTDLGFPHLLQKRACPVGSSLCVSMLSLSPLLFSHANLTPRLWSLLQ